MIADKRDGIPRPFLQTFVPAVFPACKIGEESGLGSGLVPQLVFDDASMSQDLVRVLDSVTASLSTA